MKTFLELLLFFLLRHRTTKTTYFILELSKIHLFRPGPNSIRQKKHSTYQAHDILKGKNEISSLNYQSHFFFFCDPQLPNSANPHFYTLSSLSLSTIKKESRKSCLKEGSLIRAQLTGEGTR